MKHQRASELEVAKIIQGMPPDAFLPQYVDYAGWATDAHLAYHVGVGLALLSQTVPLSYGLQFKRTKPSLYVMLVGRSRRARKSHAITLGQQILWRILPLKLGL